MASRLTHAILGDVEFDPERDDNVWETSIEWASRTVRVDLWFHGATMNSSALTSVARFAVDVAGFDQLARLAMREDWSQEGSAVRDYLDHHLDDLGADERSAALGTEDGRSMDADTFLSRMHLTRIGLYPDTADSCAVFDYTTGSELTDNLIAVKFDDGGKVIEIAMES
ncbi:hypothetical protein GCM10010399_86380 [Dactylosporangium fulvum]